MSVRIMDIAKALEDFAPLAYQESYDNSGLIVGDQKKEVTSCLISLDCTPDVVDEAISKGCGLIVSHHPIVFNGLKSFTGKTYVERTIIKAIKNDIAIYACHTNLDNVAQGVNAKIAEKLNLNATRILQKKSNTLSKIVTYVPILNLSEVQASIHASGAGKIGNYDYCSFRVNGTGTFRPMHGANPVIGEVGKVEELEEVKLEVMCKNQQLNEVLKATIKAHPYEEVAYEILPIQNQWEMGSGMIGNLDKEMSETEFLNHVKHSMNCEVIKYTPVSKKIKKVAICGGAGSFLLKKALSSGADAFITSDMKYHEFFDGESKLMICDIGHYESEKFTQEIFAKVLSDKFPNFAALFSDTNTNPIKYYTN